MEVAKDKKSVESKKLAREEKQRDAKFEEQIDKVWAFTTFATLNFFFLWLKFAYNIKNNYKIIILNNL